MVDWEWVDRERGRGRGWEEIAEDGRSEFVPEVGAGSAGRQLRRLARARRAEESDEERAALAAGAPARKWNLARVGWVLFPFFAPWALLAFLLPSPVGTYVPTIPFLGLGAAIAAAVLAFGLLRTAERWTPTFRRTATAGAVAGLVLAGTLGGVATLQGCPVLSPFTTGEPGGWVRVPHGSWAEGGSPVLFFYGSVACPYCSASSWAVLSALERLGNVSGVTYDHSSSSDAYPNTPSVVLPDLGLASGFVALDVRESTNDAKISSPSTGACIEQGYLSAYDPFGGIPFVVLGGTFVHAGTLVDPGALAGLSASDVAGQLSSHQGTAYTAVSAAAAYLLAYLVWLNEDRPANVATDPMVAPILHGIQ